MENSNTNAMAKVSAEVLAVSFAKLVLTDGKINGKTIEEVKNMSKAELEVLVIELEEQLKATNGTQSVYVKANKKSNSNIKVQLEAAAYLLEDIYAAEEKAERKIERERERSLAMARKTALEMEKFNKMDEKQIDKLLQNIEDEEDAD